MEKYPQDFWNSLGRLWDRSTGGSDVAARPDAPADTYWPVAPRAAGLDEACQWFTDGLAETKLPRYLFLVGGPGAGKSHAASEIVNPLLNRGPEPDGLAHRKYMYSVGERTLVLVNDATIGSIQAGRSLAVDVDGVIAEDAHLVACVNRGVLIEELSDADQDSLAGRTVLDWVNGRSSQEDGPWAVLPTKGSAIIRSGTLVGPSGPAAAMVAVFVDVCSLFEQSIVVDGVANSHSVPEFSGGKYNVEDYANRGSMSTSPGASLLEMVIGRLSVPEPLVDSDTLNPIAANLESLTKGGVRAGLVSIFRAAEIVSSQRMTYREVWGAIARSIVGGLPGEIERETIHDFIAENQPASGDPVKRFHQAQALASLRFTQAIFGAGRFTSAVSTDPVVRLLATVDPVRDALPGDFTGDWSSGWSTAVSDALAGSSSVSPLSTLCGGLPADDPFQSVVTSFDWNIDELFMRATGVPNLKDRTRYSLIAWYGAYLLRLYAVSNGIPAFRPEVVVWTRAWTMSPNLPGELSGSLAALLRPLRDPTDSQASSLIPLFESRTTPISGNANTAKLALKAEVISMKTSTDFEAILLELDELGKKVPPVILDFSLVREALASGAGYAGITELSDATSPRLERFRAARLVAEQLRDGQRFRIVAGESEEPITVKGPPQ